MSVWFIEINSTGFVRHSVRTLKVMFQHSVAMNECWKAILQFVVNQIELVWVTGIFNISTLIRRLEAVVKLSVCKFFYVSRLTSTFSESFTE